MAVEFDSPIEQLPAIGPRRAAALRAAGLTTVEDLLWRLPFRYEDRSRLLGIRDLEPGVPATVRAEVASARLKPTRRPGFSLVEASFRDPSGSVKAIFFNQAYLIDKLKPGAWFYLYGEPVRRELFIELVNPQLEPCDPNGARAVHAGRVVPVYERLGSLGPRAHRALVGRLLDLLAGRIPENLPARLLEEEGLLGREAAWRDGHFPSAPPPPAPELGPGLKRLAFEELFIEQLGLLGARLGAEARGGATVLPVDDALKARLREMLPFRLTSAQRRVLREVAADLARQRPMHRLLQGEVGSGKTIVAGLAMAVAALNHQQAALMAPTELLAEQHAASLSPLLERAGIATVLLTGSLGRRQRARAVEAIADGRVAVVIGTHALIQREVRFRSLALAVVDEQHRFGVAQRQELGDKGSAPHMLVMTATPIPRSLALTVYGDLDLSVLDELPPGRRPVRTVIKTEPNEAEAYGFLLREIESGRQAYVVCPLVAESERIDLKAAEAWAERVATRYLRGHSVGLVHGRMRAAERGQLMQSFARGEIEVLVGTTVIEVGVDVPNATVMIVEHAERFGLSQLHQLRGRIGRGPSPSTCILMVRGAVSDLGRARLELVRRSSDGFRIAEEDLRLRGPGEVFGTRQWGMPTHRVANLLRDFQLLERARAQARRWAAEASWLPSAEARALARAFERRYRMAEVG